MNKPNVMVLIYLCITLSGCDKIQNQIKASNHKNEIKTTFAQSQKLQDNGSNTDAIENFKKIEADPAASDQQKASALRYISLSYYELGDHPRSGEYAAKAAAYYPVDSYYYLVNMADADLMLGRIPAARERLEKAIKINPHELAANNVLGLLYLGDNGLQYADFNKALVFNQAAFDIAPGRITQIVLVRNLIKSGLYDKAEENVNALKLKYPSDQYLNVLQNQIASSRAHSGKH